MVYVCAAVWDPDAHSQSTANIIETPESLMANILVFLPRQNQSPTDKHKEPALASCHRNVKRMLFVCRGESCSNMARNCPATLLSPISKGAAFSTTSVFALRTMIGKLGATWMIFW